MKLSELYKHCKFEYICIWEKNAEDYTYIDPYDSSWEDWLNVIPLDNWRLENDALGTLCVYMENWK